MLLEKESHVLEKLKLLSVAFDYAEKKGQILDSKTYRIRGITLKTFENLDEEQ